MSLKRDIVWRVAVVYFGLLVFGFVIVFKIAWLQIFENEKYQEKAKYFKLKDLEPNRGDIYAVDGRLLVSSVPYFEIRMDLRADGLKRKVFAEKLDSLAFSLSHLFNDYSKTYYKNDLLQAYRRGERYHLIKRNVDYYQMKEIKEFPIFRRGKYKGGLIVIPNSKRYKPNAVLASRTLGYTFRNASHSVVGLEGAYNKELSGLKRERNHPNAISINQQEFIEDGYDLRTTIDINFQDVAHNALLKQLTKHDAHHGTVVLMEVKTGDIKAIANLEKTENGFREVYNYAVGESSEPGSTFKLPVIMAALEDGFVDINDTIDTGDGKITYYDKTVKDDKRGGYGKLTVKEIIEVSSNVGVSKIITDYYSEQPHKFIDRLYMMNLNDKLDIEIKGEGIPNIKYPGDKLWSGISLPMISHGYEVQLTPLQTLTFYNAIANNGKMVKPRFVRELMYHGRVVKRKEVEIINSSISSASTIRKAQKMLEGVVENGTAKSLKNSAYKIAGKTGTSQIANTNKGYRIDNKVSYQASFVGYFPANNPKYSCIVVISSPNSDVYHGNQVAGPVFKEIANKVFATSQDLHETIHASKSYFVEPPYSKNGYIPELELVTDNLGFKLKEKELNNNWGVPTKQDSCIRVTGMKFINGLVPNVKEMGAKDALYLLENAGLKVEIIGRGKVVQQSIIPGTRARKGDVITLTMSFV